MNCLLSLFRSLLETLQGRADRRIGDQGSYDSLIVLKLQTNNLDKKMNTFTYLHIALVYHDRATFLYFFSDSSLDKINFWGLMSR